MACKLIRYEDEKPEECPKGRHYVRMKIYRCDPCSLKVDCRPLRRDKCPSETPEAEGSHEGAAAGVPGAPGVPAAAGIPIVVPDYWENDYYRRIRIT